MERYFPRKIKTLVVFLLIFLLIVFAVAGVIVWRRYPFGVKQYKTITLGMPAAEKAGDHTIWAPPDNRIPEDTRFLVYSLGDETMCINWDCGVGGYFVECLGGWTSGYHVAGDTFDYGLDDELINSGKEKVITVADKDGKIIGIYPGARIRNLPYILRNHRNLVSDDVFERCLDLLPQRWEFWQKYPFGVKQYKTISLGMSSVEKGGDYLRWSHTYNTVPGGLNFFVYSLGEETMCIGLDCGIGGHFVECLNGWISGHKAIGEVANYGLDKELINSGKEKVITVADKEGKIVGIYPGARIKNLPYILRNHRNLVSDKAFGWCSDVLLPGRWK